MRSWNEANRRKEILRYLRYHGGELEPETEALIEKAMLKLREKSRPRKIWQRYALEKSEAGLQVQGTGLILSGNHIAKHLTGCSQVVLLAATLGAEADQLLHTEFLRDAALAVVLDAAANQYIEEICDVANRIIAEEAAKDGYAVTSRFSPGYGDLPLSLQPKLLALLNANRSIGLTTTASLMLLPQKSVTAVIGLSSTLSQLNLRDHAKDCTLPGKADSGMPLTAQPERCQLCLQLENCDYRGN